MTELPEGLLAVGAGVGLGPAVDADVLGQVAGVGEGLGAVGALVGLALSVVSNRGVERERKRERFVYIFVLMVDDNLTDLR